MLAGEAREYAQKEGFGKQWISLPACEADSRRIGGGILLICQ